MLKVSMIQLITFGFVFMSGAGISLSGPMMIAISLV